MCVCGVNDVYAVCVVCSLWFVVCGVWRGVYIFVMYTYVVWWAAVCGMASVFSSEEVIRAC